MKITLQVSGREMTFSEEELQVILEKHFSYQDTERCESVMKITKPTEGEWFEVVPSSINRKLFQKKKKDPEQEETRLLILEAYKFLDCCPKRYNRTFEIMMPQKTWKTKKVGDLVQMSNLLGDHLTDWVEYALQLAQRISNGETWEAVCNEPDTANWNRLIVGKDDFARIVGGAKKCNNGYPASDIWDNKFVVNDELENVVPSITRYK